VRPFEELDTSAQWRWTSAPPQRARSSVCECHFVCGAMAGGGEGGFGPGNGDRRQRSKANLAAR